METPSQKLGGRDLPTPRIDAYESPNSCLLSIASNFGNIEWHDGGNTFKVLSA